MHQFSEAWPASVAQRRNCSYLAVAVVTWFLYNEGLWRLPKPWDLFGPEAMTSMRMNGQTR